MAQAECVGALDWDTGQQYRLLDPQRGGLHGWQGKHGFALRQQYEVELKACNAKAPHTEDRFVVHKEQTSFLNEASLKRDIYMKLHDSALIRGTWFDDKLTQIRSNKWVVDPANPSQFSTQFCRMTSDSCRDGDQPYVICGGVRAKYVGVEPILDVIPKSYVLRFSLAMPWRAETYDRELCWLQLSGWFPPC